MNVKLFEKFVNLLESEFVTGHSIKLLDDEKNLQVHWAWSYLRKQTSEQSKQINQMMWTVIRIEVECVFEENNCHLIFLILIFS